MLVVTTESLPGYDIQTVLGEVLGVTACTRNPFEAGAKPLYGEKRPDFAEALLRGRSAAIDSMVAAAERLSATAIVAMRFDHRDATNNWIEICAYGTAVIAVPAT